MDDAQDWLQNKGCVCVGDINKTKFTIARAG